MRMTKRFGPGEVRALFAVCPDLFVVALSRRGLLYDSRFVPGALRSSPNFVVYVVAEGTLELFGATGRRVSGPTALLLREDHLEGGPNAGDFSYRSWGEPYVALELRLPPTAVPTGVQSASPREIVIGGRAWAAVARVLAASRHDGDIGSAARELLSELATDGFVVPGTAQRITSGDRAASRLWSAVRPFAEKLDLTASLDALALSAGRSLRQVARDLEGFTMTMTVPFSQWRADTRRFRFKAAILGLSVLELPISEVASAAGYGSVAAMGRAFREANLPSPLRVREEMLAGLRPLRG